MSNLTKKLLVAKEMAFGSKLSLLGQPVVILGSDYFRRLTETFDNIRLYELSRDSVKPFVKSSEFEDIISKEKKIRFLQRIVTSAGWGDVDIKKIETEPFHAKVHLHDSPVTKEIEGEGMKDHILRGMIAGTAEEMYDLELLGLETECIANGDEHCVVHVRPKEEFSSEMLEKHSDQIP